MRIFFKFFFILFLLSSTSNANDQLYYKIGYFDYKHETGGLLLNVKKVSNNIYSILSLGEFVQIYEFTSIIDKENQFSRGHKRKKREEYAIYLSSGLQKTIALSKNVSLVPSFSLGLYESFDQGKDMGFPIEFKSELELNLHLSRDSMLGVTFHHISNADIGDKNPGSDSILINFKRNF